ncbi:MAG: histidine phosphatase family protein [Candidatus Paceibacteria bacterium]
MKTIYFIRHGESEGNIGPVRQDGFSSLSDLGREQASFMADRCSRLPIDILVASTMTRAQETASIIGEKLGKEILSSPLFVERRRPSAQTGKPKDNPEALYIDKEIWNNFGKAGYRHSDEENFEDLRDRAREVLEFLANRPEENIAVVTHGFFMRIVLAYVVFRERLTGKECELFMRTFHMENTGLTVIKYAGSDEEPPWRVWTWNDYAHLG